MEREIRTSPHLSLLRKTVAFYFFCRGLSADHLADLTGLNRRTIFKWIEADDWPGRAKFLRLEFADLKLCPENIAFFVRRYAEADKSYKLYLNQPKRAGLYNPDLAALALKESVSWPSLLKVHFPRHCN